MERNISSPYVRLTIDQGAEDVDPSQGIVEILAHAINKPPEKVRRQLERGSLTLPKVLVNKHLRALILELKKSGFRVEARPLQSRGNDELNLSAADQAAPSGLGLPGRSSDIDLNWKAGEIIEGIYEVIGSAEGGMGKVYFVFHRLWKMNLAIKTPHADAVRSETRLMRFLREAELWVDLGLHPNIATCYYARVIRGVPRLFIEYVDGGDLNKWGQEGRLEDLRLLTDLMLQFCHGMMYAESKGMVHRDIKPHNCLVTRDKTVKITDFGLVKRVDEGAGDNQTGGGTANSGIKSADPGVTLFEDGVMGSPWYMAPERLTDRGRDDIRSDIYSFGMMLYELSTGAKPFSFPKGFSLTALFRSHLTKNPIDPRSVRPDLPLQLVDVMLTCLEKKPEDRYPSFSALCEAMEDAHRATSPSSSPRKPPNLVGLKANALNNQAVSLLDLGRQEEAIRLLENAHSANTDHLEAVYNLHALRWIRGEISDREVTRRMESLKIEVRETASFYHLMGLICLQKGDAPRGVTLLEKACKTGEHYRQRWSNFPGGPRGFVSSLGFLPIEDAGSLAGHVKSVRSVGFSQDSLKAYSMGEDRSIRIWDGETGRCLKNIRTFAFIPVTGDFSADGRMAVTGYGDSFKTLDLWDLESGQLAHRFSGMGVISVRFSPDSGYVAALGMDGRSWIIDVPSRTLVWESDVSPDAFGLTTAIGFIGDGLALLLGGEDGKVRAILPGDGETFLEVQAHAGRVTCLDVAPDSSMVLSGGADETVRLWEASSGKELLRFTGHSTDPVHTEFLPGGRYVLSASAGGIIKIWDRNTARCYRTLSMDEDLTSCTISPDGAHILCGGARGSLRLWSLDTRWFENELLEPAICKPGTYAEMSSVQNFFNGVVEEFRGLWKRGDRAGALKACEKIRSLPGFSWSREAIAIRSLVQEVSKRGRLASWSFIRSLSGHEDSVVSLHASQDSLTLLTGSLDGTAVLWDVVSGRGVKRFAVGSPVTQALHFPRSLRVVTASQDSVLRLWDLKGALLLEIPDLGAPIALSTGGSEIAAVSRAGEPVRIDLEKNRVLSRGAPIKCDRFVCFSARLDTVYSLRGETRIQRWSVSSGRNEGSFRDLGRKITALEPAPRSDRLIAAMEDGEIIIYFVGSGINVGGLRSNLSPVRSVDASKDGRHLVAGADDCSLRVWDLSEERCIAVLEGHSRPIRCVHFFPNMALVASSSAKGSVRLWGLEWELSPVGG